MQSMNRMPRVAGLTAVLIACALAACSTAPVSSRPADVHVLHLHGNRWLAASNSMEANRTRSDEVCAKYKMKARSEREEASRSQRIFHATGDGSSLTGSWVMQGKTGQELTFVCV